MPSIILNSFRKQVARTSGTQPSFRQPYFFHHLSDKSFWKSWCFFILWFDRTVVKCQCDSGSLWLQVDVNISALQPLPMDLNAVAVMRQQEGSISIYQQGFTSGRNKWGRPIDVKNQIRPAVSACTPCYELDSVSNLK